MNKSDSLENIKTLDFNPLTIPTKRWDRYHEYRRTLHNQRYPNTPSDTSNSPMLSINNRLGFKFHRESIEAQISLEKLNQYLKSKEAIL